MLTLRSIDSASPLISEGRCRITPALAERVLSEMRYGRQRRIYSHHVTLLSDLMRRGQWTPGSQIAFGRLDGELFLVNGQHRLRGVAETGLAQEFQVLILDAETEAELAALYHRFDVAARARSVPEILNAADMADRHGLSRGMAKTVYDAAGYINAGFVRPNYQVDPVAARSVDARLEAAEAWWDIATAYEAIVNLGDKTARGKMRAPGIAAVAFVTLKHQETKAREFWTGVAQDDGLRKGDPRKTLFKALTEKNLRNGGTYVRSAVPATAWNAWFRGDSITFIRHQDKVRIAGTPYAIGGAAAK